MRQFGLRPNKISIIPLAIGDLKFLRYLDLSFNEITEYPYDLININLTIDFENNQIFKSNSGLNLFSNPIVTPPIDVVKKGKDSIRSYYEFIENEETTKLHEAKLLIVGEGGVGKTSLKRSLIYRDFNSGTNTTEGIDIENWIIDVDERNKFRVNMWDFGGQEIYHSTHQFFLTKRSLYLFVWDARRDDEVITFDYWLNVVKLLSDGSPIILVLNKIDERTKNIDYESIKNKFPNIVGFHKVSSKTGEGIEDLSSRIENEIIDLYHSGDKLPITWQEIRNELQSLNQNFITYEDYQSICKKYNLSPAIASYLSSYLHDLGVFLHFEDNSVLRDVIFLKPAWATSAVYQVIDSKKAQVNMGELTRNDFSLIWSNYPSTRHAELLELMKKFELCLQVPSTNSYIIPELLSPTRPELDWDFAGNARFEYQYDFMPSGIITRLIVRTADINRDKIYWKNGLIVSVGSSNALIQSDAFRKTITIWLRGKNNASLLQMIRREISIIHETMNYPEVQELLPCICGLCKNNDNPYKFNHDYVQGMEKKSDRDFVTCQISLEDVKTNDLLGFVHISPDDAREQYNYNSRVKILTTYLSAIGLFVALIFMFVDSAIADSLYYKIGLVISFSTVLLFAYRSNLKRS